MIIITGATGLTGSHLLMQLAGEKEPVRCLVRPGTDHSWLTDFWRNFVSDPEKLYKNIEWVEADLLSNASISEAISGWKKIYHCAGVVSFHPGRRTEIWNTNVLAVRNLIDCCLEQNTGKFIHMSSVAAIGKPFDNGMADETCGWPVKPRSGYAKSKTMGELEVWRGIHEGLDAVIVNPTVILGSSMRKQGSSMIFETLRKGISFYPGGSTGFVDVQDVAGIMIKLGNSNITGERFLLNGINLTYKELFEKAALKYGNKPPAHRLPGFVLSTAWMAERVLTFFTGKEPRITRSTALSSRSHQKYSSQKITDALNIHFRPIDETIADITAFYKKQDLS